MEAVIDPSGPTCVSFVQTGTVLYNDFATFDLVPVTDDLVGKPLKVSLVDDAYVLSLDVDAVSAAVWTQLRTERNARLAATDWTQLQDSHLSDAKKAAWADYRQALRDLPDEVTDPTNVDWPLDLTQTPVAPPSTGSRLDGISGQV